MERWSAHPLIDRIFLSSMELLSAHIYKNHLNLFAYWSHIHISDFSLSIEIHWTVKSEYQQGLPEESYGRTLREKKGARLGVISFSRWLFSIVHWTALLLSSGRYSNYLFEFLSSMLSRMCILSSKAKDCKSESHAVELLNCFVGWVLCQNWIWMCTEKHMPAQYHHRHRRSRHCICPLSRFLINASLKHFRQLSCRAVELLDHHLTWFFWHQTISMDV